jgi:DNA topoisomerase-1
VGVNLEEIDARAVNSIRLFDDSEGRAVHVRVGRYGAYLERMVSADGAEAGELVSQKANLPEDLSPDELTLEVAEKLFSTPQEGRTLGVDPLSGHEIVAKEGRFGPYVTELLPDPPEDGAAPPTPLDPAPVDLPTGAGGVATGSGGGVATGSGGGVATKTRSPAKKAPAKKAAAKAAGPKPRTGSLFASMDLATITLEDALRLLSLPRVVGVDPVSGEEITAQNGRYGPYLKRGTDSRSLTDEEQLFTVSVEEALKIYAEPKRRGRAAAAPPLRELGSDPVSGAAMVVKEGRFGPYVTDGETNASLRKGDVVETLTDERAVELLAERRARGPAPKKTAKKAPAKKAPAKKTTAAKKAPAKKTTAAKKAPARKATAATKAPAATSPES